MNVETMAQPLHLQNVSRGDRVARTREAIVVSTLSLAQEGEVAPIVRDIAKAAGVSARTVFQHFADTAELYVAVLNRVLVSSGGDAANVGQQGSLDQRLSTVISHRSANYEKLRPMWTFIATLQRRSTQAAEKLRLMYTLNREQLARSFNPELSLMPGEKRECALNALMLALSPESWVMLRERLGLTADQARDEWRFLVQALFKDGPADR